MSALQEIRQNGEITTLIETSVRAYLWKWIHLHPDISYTLKIWFISKKFKISELHGLFALILGPDTYNL